MRTQKKVGSKVTDYYYDSNNNLIAEKTDSATLFFYYNTENSPVALSYNGKMFYYVKNIQGDIVKILDEDGNEKASYVYNAWGDILSQSEDELSSINPLRYRGYVYDEDTAMYYLQTRYYDPTTGRFINADNTIFIGSSGTAIGDNIYTYCENDPVNNVDYTGQWYHSIKKFNKIKLIAKKQEVSNYKAMGYTRMYKIANKEYSRLKKISYLAEYHYRFNMHLNIKYNSYIYGQAERKYFALTFGGSTVMDKGCVSVALYNAMFKIGRKQNLSQIILELELNEMILNNGFKGTLNVAVPTYFKGHKVSYKEYDNTYEKYKKNAYKYRVSVVIISGHAFCIIKSGKSLKTLNFDNNDMCAKPVKWSKIKKEFISAYCIK